MYEIGSKELGKRVYHHCETCGGIFLDRAYLLSSVDEKNRYEKHDNSLKNAGYRRYLEDFISAVLTFPALNEENPENRRKIHDFGSGPEPALATLLGEKGFEVHFSDKFFAPLPKMFPGGADILTCLEVAEHFMDPLGEFALMASLLRPGGFLALGTLLLESGGTYPSIWDFFAPWWYRQDATHISFYSEKSLRLVAGDAGFEWQGQAGPHIYLFKKIQEVARS